MNWKIGDTEYPVTRLATLLGVLAGLTASALGLLFKAEWGVVLWLGITSALGGSLTLVAIFLVDLTLSALREGGTRRSRMKAAQRVFELWATKDIEPPDNLQTAVYRVGGEVRTLAWLQDDDAETGKWRWLLVHMFQFARSIYRETQGKRTGFTEADLVGDAGMFYGREGYLNAIKVAKDLGLVERVNGIPTRLAEGWNFTKAISYLQTAAVIPPIKTGLPGYRPYKGTG